MPPLPRRRLPALLLPWGGTVAAALGLLIFLGCLSIGSSTDSHSSPESEGTFEQKGSLVLGPGQERDIYYPTPYVSPPYLKFPIESGYELTAQQPTYFRVRNVSKSECTVVWEARGVKGKITQTIMPGLPPAPIPVDPTPQSLGTER
jgi:hypothetical protein